MNMRSDNAIEKRSFQTSCERCRKRKIKCDCTQPCSRCYKAKSDCVYIGSGEKRRPVPRGYVQALEGQIASLEKFITKLIVIDASTRDEMLATFSKSSNHFRVDPASVGPHCQPSEAKADGIPIRSRTGHFRRVNDGKSSKYHGATSFFQISPSDEHIQVSASPEAEGTLGRDQAISRGLVEATEPSPADDLAISWVKVDESSEDESIFSPKSEICQYLMGEFFRKQYHYFMYLYREGFMIDYDAGEGPYYSDVLLYAICSMGALVSDDLRELSDIFFSRAQEILYRFALESPNLTTLQALLLMGHREIGWGRTSKGWLLSGMAFRLAHEMGLHLDPNNWNESDDSRVAREILRRTYWAAFVADKQLSLYFGRPPALHPNESDVISTVRIPYPPEWQPLLNKYILEGTLATEFEDGDGLVAFFIQQAELSKILHRIITDVFENRSVKADETVLATSVQEIQVSLRKWASDLPAKLHWNEWSVGQIPSLVLYLHMQYHAAMIILHRPPRHLFQDPKITSSEDVETCYQSLESIIRLLKIYSRNYHYNYLPVTFVHILASASSVILMKQYIGGLSWDDLSISKPLELVLNAVDGISQTWPCAGQVKRVITVARTSSVQSVTQTESPESFDLMAGLAGGNNYDPMNFDLGLEIENIEDLLNPNGIFDDILDRNNVFFP